MTVNSIKPMLMFAANHSVPPEARQTRFDDGLIRYKALRLVAICLISAFTVGCSATDSNHPLRGAASTVGFATTAGEPKDFVKARRGTEELAYVPIGRGGVERPVAARGAAGVKDLETELDRTRDQSEGFARRQLPAGAYGQQLPSLAAPARRVNARAGAADQPTPGAPESYPVNPNRLRQIRQNSRQTTDQ
jgi:hypothetical protein